MKLKNKKTGEIGTLIVDGAYKFVTNLAVEDDEMNRLGEYNSLAELNEEWEDYEEPKDFWYIDDFMTMCGTEGEFTTPDLASFTKKDIEKLKAIGNYFETREEAEKAVEKLKALTEAKEDGLKIKGYYYNHEDLVILADIGKCNKLTLDTLFGKEID